MVSSGKDTREKTSVGFRPEVKRLLKLKAADRGLKLQDSLDQAVMVWIMSRPVARARAQRMLDAI